MIDLMCHSDGGIGGWRFRRVCVVSEGGLICGLCCVSVCLSCILRGFGCLVVSVMIYGALIGELRR